MPKQTTLPDAVRQAELKLAELQGKYLETQRAVDMAKHAVQQAHIALRAERMRADQALPACQIVTVKRYSGNVIDPQAAVIVRKAPTGMLVVRRVGDPIELRFKRKHPTSHYEQVQSGSRQASDWLELRGLPAEFA